MLKNTFIIFICMMALSGCFKKNVPEATDETCNEKYRATIEDNEIKEALATKCFSRGSYKMSNDPDVSVTDMLNDKRG
nr:hypothetical protein [uncultured bacterium]